MHRPIARRVAILMSFLAALALVACAWPATARADVPRKGGATAGALAQESKPAKPVTSKKVATKAKGKPMKKAKAKVGPKHAPPPKPAVAPQPSHAARPAPARA